MSDEHCDDEIDVDNFGGDYLFLRCDDRAFGRLFQSLKSQSGVTGDLGDPTAIHIEKKFEKKSAYKAGPLRDSTWSDRIGLFGCVLVAMVVIIGLVNGAMTIANFFSSF